MSSEALERAQKALRTPDLEWAGDLVHGLANDVLALSAELDETRGDYWRDVAAHYKAKVAAEAALAVAHERAEKAEQARDEHYKTASLIYDDLVAMESRALAAEAALAVAREREQRLTEALEAISWMNDHDAVYHAANRARAALVDEPAAAAEQNAAESTVTPGGTEVGLTVPGAAAATLTCPRCGNETTEADLTYSGCGVCRAEAAAADLVDAVADEPGETP